MITEARADPCFLGLGLLLFCVLAGAGIGAVLGVASAASLQEQDRAQSLVNDVGTSFAAHLLGALAPSLAARAFVESGPAPTHAAVQAWFARAAPALVASSSAIDDIQLAPYGHAAAIFPLVSARRDARGLLLGGDVGHGHDLFNASSVIANRRSAAILALRGRILQIEGPKNLLSSATTCTISCAFGQSGLLSRIPLFVETTSTSDDWSQNYTWTPAPGGPIVGPFTSVTGCASVVDPGTGLSLCDTNATGAGTRFWGFFTVISVWAEILSLAHVDSLGAAGYMWSIARSAEGSDTTSGAPFPWVVVSSSDGPLPTSAYAAGRVSDSFAVYSSVWVFTVQPRSGTWAPAWQGGAIAGVVILAAALTFLALVAALQQRLNERLLYSMLPRHVVTKLRAGEARQQVAEPFAHATLLFTDIVRFTDLVATITPQETMAMLNALFLDFDEIAQRRGVVKLETIGDAFVGYIVSGTPQAQAQQMAHFALDLVDCAARHELPNGGELRIRVGVHCGPVVAGVVGKSLPHYSLFGDTVNTTARMESTSIPGRAHVSSEFARVLRQAELAAEAATPFPFVLQSRGAIAVKGKGVMTTHFLLRRGEALTPEELSISVPSSPPTEAGGGSLASGSVAGPNANARSFYVNPAAAAAKEAAVRETAQLSGAFADVAVVPDSP